MQVSATVARAPLIKWLLEVSTIAKDSLNRL
jgi:hypothetical protein